MHCAVVKLWTHEGKAAHAIGILLRDAVQVGLKVKDEEEEDKAKDASPVKWAGYKSGHEGPEIPVGRHPVKANVGDHSDVPPHKDLIGEGLRVLVKIKECQKDKEQQFDEASQLIGQGLIPPDHLYREAVIKGLVFPVIVDVYAVQYAHKEHVKC